MIKLRRLTLALGILVLAGCGGGDDSGYSDAAAVAKAAGCTSFQEDAPGAYDVPGGHCEFNGHDTVVQWFDDDDSKDTWKHTALSALKLGRDTTVLIGSNWAIECHSKADCSAMKDHIGGTLS